MSVKKISISDINPEVLAKAGLGHSTGFKHLENIVTMLPATLDEIMEKTGLKYGSIRRYFSIAKDLNIHIMNDRNRGKYEIYIKSSETQPTKKEIMK